MQKKRKVIIDYTNTDFNGIKNQLVEYSKRYYPDTNKDYSENSFGSLMIDQAALIGDMLSFYLTYGINESFLDSALEYQNVLRIGRSLGYKFDGAPSSFGTLTYYILCPANSNTGGVDSRYLPTLMKGSRFSSGGGASFILTENVDFSKGNNEVVVGAVSETTGLPTSFAVKAQGSVISGEMEEQIITIGAFQKFPKIKLAGQNISEILSVVDSEGHDYFEVDNLSQNVIWKSIANPNAELDRAQEILKPVVVYRKFVVEKELDATYLQFGGGSDDEQINTTNVLDPSNVALQLSGKNYVTSDSFDPSILLSSQKFGVAPSMTSLKILTRSNPIDTSNAASNTVTEVTSPIFNFNNVTQLDSGKVSGVIVSLECTNEEQIVGSLNLPNSDELRIRIKGTYAAQNRAVTSQDYSTVAYNMPARLGSIKRAKVVQDSNSFKRNLNMYLVGEDANGSLAPVSNMVKQNLKNWLSTKKILGDSVDLLDAVILNYGINFSILAEQNVNKFSALADAVDSLTSYFSNYLGEIGEYISISEIFSVLKNVSSVNDVVTVEIFNKTGTGYSDVSVSIDDLLDPSGRLVRCPSNCIWELRNASQNIFGTIA